MDKIDLTSNAIKMLERRYLKKDESGQTKETVDEMFRRLAKNVASAQKLYGATKEEIKAKEEEIYQVMASLQFLPDPSVLGANERPLSACFVLPLEDSIEGIFEAVKNGSVIHRLGGGTGFSLSKLRSRGEGVLSNSASFMKLFEAAIGAVKEEGAQRGASIALVRVDHPDILDFISLRGENLSFGLTDKFMEAVTEDKEYSLIDPETKKGLRRLKAKMIFSKLLQVAFENGKLSVIFLDRINKDNPTPKIGQIEAVSPCGEQPLLPYEFCSAGFVNLSKMVTKISGKVKIDYQQLSKTIETAVEFLDNVIDIGHFPLSKIEEVTKANRKIGLGVMGFADLLLKLKIPYDGEEALRTAKDIASFINEEAKRASIQIASLKGVFPNFEGSIYDLPDGNKVRNATITAILPTGAASVVANASRGIEPIFAVAYFQPTPESEEEIQPNPIFEKIAKEEGFYSLSLMKRIAKRGTIKGLKEIPAHIQQLFVTAQDVRPQFQVKMQSAFQEFTDMAVSKTISFPPKSKGKDISEAILLAYRGGCKGISAYLSMSREDHLLRMGEQERSIRAPRRRPSVTKGLTEKIQTGCGNLYVTINEDGLGPCEVFTQMGKSGGCAASQSEAISRLISLALRSGIDPESVFKQLKGIRCPSPLLQHGEMILSCSDAIGKAIEQFLTEGGYRSESGEEELDLARMSFECPDCKGILETEGGSFICRTCGYFRCG